MKLRHNLVLMLIATVTLATTSNAMQRTKGMTILKFMQEENKAVVQTADDKAKELIEKFVTNITKEDTDALCTILLDTIKLDDKAMQYLTKELCTKLLFLALEHNKPLTFSNLLRLDNADPNAIDPLTGHTLTYMTVKFNNPDCLALLTVPYHAKLSYTPKTYHLTPLQLAENMGYKQCKLILIAAGAKE